MTVELWAWDEQFIEWGGYVVAVQDNGAFEKGWLLGTRWKAFSFALSSEDADDGDGLLTYLNAANASEMNEWYHVVGTYDSKEMKIYVNGNLRALRVSSRDRSITRIASFSPSVRIKMTMRILYTRGCSTKCVSTIGHSVKKRS